MSSDDKNGELIRLATLPKETREQWSKETVVQFTDAVARALSAVPPVATPGDISMREALADESYPYSVRDFFIVDAAGRKVNVVGGSQNAFVAQLLNTIVEQRRELRKARSASAPTNTELDLAMTVRRLCHKINIYTEGSKDTGADIMRNAAARSLDFLKRKGLQGSPLRNEAPLTERPDTGGKE